MISPWWTDAVTDIVLAAIDKGLIKKPQDIWEWVSCASRNYAEAEMDARPHYGGSNVEGIGQRVS